MGGEVRVVSKLGEGSTFTFSLPIYKGQKSSSNGKKNDSKNMFEKLELYS